MPPPPGRAGEKRSVLITGVAGFIGSNLAQALLERGHAVVGVDNMSQGEALNLEGLLGHPSFQMHYVDIRDEAGIRAAARGCGVIVHLAAFKIPRYSDALDTLTINSIGSESVVKAALEEQAKVVAASTSDVYGKNPKVPFDENSSLVIGNPDVRRWAYAISKMFEEQLLFAYHERHGIDVVPIRFFGGYGPNQNLTWWGGPQSVFINKALDDEEIEVHGDGLQTRSFTYVSDHVDGIVRIIDNPAANNLVFNLGNTQEITILDLARLVWRLIRGDQPPRIKQVPYATFGKYEDVQRRIPDITRARTLLGFEPMVDLEDGLRRTIEWQVGRRKRLGIATPHVPACLG
ncbi:MAG: GDP-mannose 4,6-dehydratase [Vicinamibacteria bacterium]|nr:GDP-mannose 4,6-dehydratase [Vicinamibacteria bacterium]